MADEPAAEPVVNATPAPDGIAPKPEGVPDKFYNSESGLVDYDGMTKSYNELSTKLGGKPAPKTEGFDLTKPAPTVEPLGDDAGVNAIVERAGLVPAEVVQQFINEKKLTETQYEALAKQHITRTMANEFLGAQAHIFQTQQAATRAEAEGFFGGSEQVNNVLAWAATNLSDAEKQEFTRLSSNPETSKMSLQMLKSRMEEVNGSAGENPLIGGTGGGGSQGGGYTSQIEMGNAVSDPRYSPDSPKYDANYAAQVQRRLLASKDPSQLRAV